MITEDSVRDGYTNNNDFIKGAKQILKFDIPESNANQGTGQITTFKQLGFTCPRNSKKPDGWYLPLSFNDPAIVLETKNSEEDLDDPRWIKEIIENCDIVLTKYNKVIGILYNGEETRIYKNKILVPNCANNVLQEKNFYLNLFNNESIDKRKIYKHTKSINENLHTNFGVKNLNHRMIFTACALVAERYDARLETLKDRDFSFLHHTILSSLNKSLKDSKNQNDKLGILEEVYSHIRMNYSENQNAINNFIDDICEISKSINSTNWNGEDVMAIFFNEFNRYRGKSEAGQVFTPDHIVSLMYRLLECNKDDVILDACCGSGTFLVKSMANMIKEAGGPDTEKAKHIKQKQLYGIEFDEEIYALACANMLIHKDGKSNLIKGDTRSAEMCEWIKKAPITKVLMNPPYETKYGCMKIVANVLNNVRPGTKCAFILPNKKLEKTKSFKLLKKHTLYMIVKLPKETFDEGTGDVSVFFFEANKPQGNKKIKAWNIEKDGLIRIKNERRQDVNDNWKDIEDYWVDVICNGTADKTFVQIIPSPENLSYPEEEKEFVLYEEDFRRAVMDYNFFKQNTDVKTFNEELLNSVLYSSDIKQSKSKTLIELKVKTHEND